VFVGALDRLLHRPRGDHLADTVTPIEERDGASVRHQLRVGHRANAPERSRAAHQGRRSTPWDGWP
jgi:hypothetical protein